jgi:hypothetical protein
MRKNILMTLTVALFSVSAMAQNGELKQDKEAVDSACSAEAKTANCGDAKVGTGLLKCIHGYKKEHKKEFTISDGCKSAMKKLKADRKEMKEKRQSEKK